MRSGVFFLTVLIWCSEPTGLKKASAAEDAFEAPPILYSATDPHNPVTELQSHLDDGTAVLEFDDEQGYLKGVLKLLQVPVSSQMLVFSKTSLQIQHISPRSPRAIYFNDDVYVGWVQGGERIEISVADSRLGAVFYTLDQRQTDAPRFQRETHQCLQCHASRRTQDVPGHLVRSLYTAFDGRPIFNAGTYDTDHTSPFDQRWGGWYVTGEHGAQRHMGNVLVMDRQQPEEINRDAGANVTKLDSLFDTSPYLTGHSDIVAMMVMAHQAQMHNHIAATSFETRQALHSNDVMNRALDRDDDYRSDSTERRINKAAEKLLHYLLFVDEVELSQPVKGSTSFADEFAQTGPKDHQGRSLRDLDLQKRLFRYPCSFLIYSAAFRQLPPDVKDVVLRRLWDVLQGVDVSAEFQHIRTADRQAILEILRETLPDLPDYWHAHPAADES